MTKKTTVRRHLRKTKKGYVPVRKHKRRVKILRRNRGVTGRCINCGRLTEINPGLHMCEKCIREAEKDILKSRSATKNDVLDQLIEKYVDDDKIKLKLRQDYEKVEKELKKRLRDLKKREKEIGRERMRPRRFLPDKMRKDFIKILDEDEGESK